MIEQILDRRSMLIVAALLVAVAVLATPCSASVTLTFDGLQDLEPILGYFNGDYGGMGSGPGPQWGITFSEDAVNVLSADDGGHGNFATSPVLDYPNGANPNVGIAAFLTGSMVIDVPAGFDAPLSFWYMSIMGGTVVTFYNQPGGAAGVDDGTGTRIYGDVLGSTELTSTYDDTPEDGVFTQWDRAVLGFDGSARSVQFQLDGSAVVIAFDQMTFNLTGDSNSPSTQTAPEPTTLMTWSIFAALGGLVFTKRTRRVVT